MTDKTDLPFSLADESIDGWLSSLADQLPANATNKLHQTLKTLKECELEASVMLTVLIKLTPLALHLTNGLAVAALQEIGKKDGKLAKIPRLCGQVLRNLNLLLCKQAESEQLDQASLKLAIYYALQTIGYSLRCSALFREAPSQTLWKKSAALYQQADAATWLSETLPIKLADFKTLPNISTVIKRNLLFYLCTMPYPVHQDVIRLFAVANQQANSIELSPKPLFDFGFYWDIVLGTTPSAVKQPDKPLPLDHLAIGCESFAAKLARGEIEGLSDAGLKDLRFRFDYYRNVFDSIVAAAPVIFHWQFGFDAVAEHLKAQHKLAKIMQLGSQASGPRPPRGMALEPLEHEKSFFQHRLKADGKSVATGKAVNVLRTTTPGFQVMETRSKDCQLGELAVLFNEQQSEILGCIRQLTRHDVSGGNHVLLETLPGSIEVYDFQQEQTTARVIILTQANGEQQALLPPGRYMTQTSLNLAHGKSLQLLACVEAASGFVRFQVKLD